MDFTDQDALDAIARLLDGNEWGSDLVSYIAEIVNATGRSLKEPVNSPNEAEESWRYELELQDISERARYLEGLTSEQRQELFTRPYP